MVRVELGEMGNERGQVCLVNEKVKGLHNKKNIVEYYKRVNVSDKELFK